MGLKIDWVTIDCHDPRSLATFWAQALSDYQILEDPESEDDEDEEILLLPVARKGTKILFLKVPDEKTVKNRVHLDLRSDDADMAVEVARLESLGATKVDIGQGEVSWTVMADPEGNEFCILRTLSAAEKQKYSDWAW